MSLVFTENQMFTTSRWIDWFLTSYCYVFI